MYKKKIYFDTDSVVKGLCKNTSDSKYSPENPDFKEENKPYISLNVIEEFLHANAYYKAYDEYEEADYDNFIEVWRDFAKFRGHFDVLKPDMGKVLATFNRLINLSIRELGRDFEEEYGKDYFPGGKDFMHLAIADVGGCDGLFSCDSDFGYIEELIGNKELREVLANVKKIYHLYDDLDDFKDKVNLAVKRK